MPTMPATLVAPPSLSMTVCAGSIMGRQCSYFRYDCKPLVAILNTDGCSAYRYIGGMKKLSKDAQWVSQVVAKIEAEDNGEDGGQAELARRVAKVLGIDFDRSKINKIINQGRWVQVREMRAIEEISGIPHPSSARANHIIPILDKIQAGKLAAPASQVPLESVAFLTVPKNKLPPGDYFALEVEGNSMNKLTPPGSIIIVDRKDKQLITGAAYVFFVEGEATFKNWRARPESLCPDSTDPDFKPILVDRKKGLEVIGRVVKRLV